MQIAAFAILGLVSLAIGFILQLVLPELRYIAWGIIGLGVILIAGSLILEFRRVRTALVSRRGKFSASTTILVSTFIGIILLANAVSASFYRTFDFSSLAQFTLTTQTKDVLSKIEIPINVYCFFVPSVPNVDSSYQDIYVMARSYAPALLSEYMNYTNKLKISLVDPDQHPEEARKYGVTNEYLYQSVVFETTQGYRVVTAGEIYSQAENSFTSAILEVTGIKQKKVYFLTGHGEADPTDTSSVGYDYARRALQDNLYLVSTLDLLTIPAVPDDCAALIVAGPQTKMADSELQALADYLKKNGQVFFMTNPGSPDDIAKLLAPWGVDVKNGTVIDPTSYATPNQDSPMIDRDHNYFSTMPSVYFPGATAIVAQDTPPTGMQVSPMLITSFDAWMTDKYDPTANQNYDATKDSGGPFYIGVFIFPAQPTDQNAQPVAGPIIAVIGDSDFATNKNFFSGNNGDLFTNIASGFAAGKQLVSINRLVLQTRKLLLTPEKSRFMNISSIALLPVLVLVIGVIVWWRRK